MTGRTFGFRWACVWRFYCISWSILHMHPFSHVCLPYNSGTHDGQTAVIREGDNGVAYSWNSKESKWDKVRNVFNYSTSFIYVLLLIRGCNTNLHRHSPYLRLGKLLMGLREIPIVHCMTVLHMIMVRAFVSVLWYSFYPFCLSIL